MNIKTHTTTLEWFKAGAKQQFSYYYSLLATDDREQVILTILEENNDMEFIKGMLSNQMILDLNRIRNTYDTKDI